MKFTDPRTAIAEAYAVNMRARTGERGSEPIDSSIVSFRIMKAGKIIAAVENQPAPYRNLMIYQYAPPDFHSERLVEEIWELLQKDYYSKINRVARERITPAILSRIPTVAKRVVTSYHKSKKLGIAEIMSSADIYCEKAAKEEWGVRIERMFFTLDQWHEDAMQPIQKIIDQERDRIGHAEHVKLIARLDATGISVARALKYVNAARGDEGRITLNQINRHEMEMIERQLDLIDSINTTDAQLKSYLFERGLYDSDS